MSCVSAGVHEGGQGCLSLFWRLKQSICNWCGRLQRNSSNNPALSQGLGSPAHSTWLQASWYPSVAWQRGLHPRCMPHSARRCLYPQANLLLQVRGTPRTHPSPEPTYHRQETRSDNEALGSPVGELTDNLSTHLPSSQFIFKYLFATANELGVFTHIQRLLHFRIL